MHERKALALLTAISIFAVVGLGSSSADAVGTIMSLPTYACQRVSGGIPANGWSGLYNKGPDVMKAQCGVPTNSDVDTPTNWTVALDDKNSSKNFRCEMRIVDGEGGIVATGGGQITTGTGQQNLYWDWSILSPVQVGGLFGATYVSCTVPPIQGTAQSGITGIFVSRRF